MKPTCSEQSLTKLSPFAEEKSILERYGTVKQVKKLKDGYLLFEVEKYIQAQLILDTQKFLDIEVDADAHHSLIVSKEVIRDHNQDLMDMSDEDIRKELSPQGVLKVNRFILKKDGKDIKSKIEKVPRGIQGEKSIRDMASSRNLVSTIGAQASPKKGDRKDKYLIFNIWLSETSR